MKFVATKGGRGETKREKGLGGFVTLIFWRGEKDGRGRGAERE